jgi:hypothetical protein
MRAAAAAGSPEALQQLLLAYAPERSPRGTLLQQAITPDPVEAQAILRLMQERGIALPRSEMGRRGEAMEPPASLSRLDAAVLFGLFGLGIADRHRLAVLEQQAAGGLAPGRSPASRCRSPSPRWCCWCRAARKCSTG